MLANFVSIASHQERTDWCCDTRCLTRWDSRSPPRLSKCFLGGMQSSPWRYRPPPRYAEFCGLPLEVAGTLQALHDSVPTPEVPIRRGDRSVLFRNLTIARGPPATREAAQPLSLGPQWSRHLAMPLPRQGICRVAGAQCLMAASWMWMALRSRVRRSQ